ncbi:unnamed protein product [Moneuplotes crassus]|uniref:Uncharacterized protein n=1 Tax=Euplotes crassus TaxID=5936 RepID=A0AAD1XAA9_EUPCR|nr:unnamed protein product [Moneuplotes crassus]
MLNKIQNKDSEIQQLHSYYQKENEGLQQSIEILTEEKKCIEEDYEVLSKSLKNHEEYTYEEFNSLHDDEQNKIKPEAKMRLHLDQWENIQLLRSLKKRMPEIYRLAIHNMPSKCEEVRKLLLENFPARVQVFNFNYYSYPSGVSPFLSIYKRELIIISQRVLKDCYIYNFKICQSDLIILLSKYKHVKIFGFIDCQLENLPNLKFDEDFKDCLKETNLIKFDLNRCFTTTIGDWADHSYFENLIRRLGREKDFVEKLRMIELEGCGMHEHEIRTILNENGFEKAKIII